MTPFWEVFCRRFWSYLRPNCRIEPLQPRQLLLTSFVPSNSLIDSWVLNSQLNGLKNRLIVILSIYCQSPLAMLTSLEYGLLYTQRSLTRAFTRHPLICRLWLAPHHTIIQSPLPVRIYCGLLICLADLSLRSTIGLYY